MNLHVYFDYGSPYAYLAWQRIRAHPERYEAVNILWKPVSAGHIFKQDGSRPNTAMPNQGAYLYHDLARWTEAYGVPFNPPTKDAPHAMPVNSIKAMRLHFVADQQGPAVEAAWMEAVFMAYFQDGLNIHDDAVLAKLASLVGLEGGIVGAANESVKKLLIANTQEAYDAGAPGVPYFVLEHDGKKGVYWGNDRLAWVEAKIAGASAPA